MGNKTLKMTYNPSLFRRRGTVLKKKYSKEPYERLVDKWAYAIVRDGVSESSLPEKLPKRWSRKRRKEYNRTPFKDKVRNRCYTIAIADAITEPILDLVRKESLCRIMFDHGHYFQEVD